MEKFFTCPYCQQRISMILDDEPQTDEERQTYIEDCEVCCHPIQVSYSVGPSGEIEGFEAVRAQ